MRLCFNDLLVITILGLSSCQSSKIALNQQEKDAGNKMIQHLLASPKYMMYETSFLTAVHYAEVCAAYGAVAVSLDQKDASTLRKIEERYKPLTHQSIARQAHHVDGNVYGILPLSLYKWNKDTELKQHGLFLADAQWNTPLPDGLTHQARYWIDDIYMVNSLQLEAFTTTGDTAYINKAALFTKKYLDSLQQKNGLFFHGPEAPIYWGRGIGWVAAGVAILIKQLPKSHIYYKPITDSYKKMMVSLLAYQTPNGMWRQIIDYPEAWEESSCTAMFAYAMSCGIHAGLLDKKTYAPSLNKARLALLANLDEKARLKGICAGTGQSKDIAYYLSRPRIDGDFHGQAPMLWLYHELGDR